MLIFSAVRNNETQGYVHAVSMKQAKQRAYRLFGRCDVIGMKRKSEPVAIDSYSSYR